MSLLPLAALLLPMARADVVVEEYPTASIHHQLEVSGLPEGHVLVLAADTSEVSCVVPIRADGSVELNSPYQQRCAMGERLVLKAMKSEDYASWTSRTRPLVQEQRLACTERGEGCESASGFRPQLPWPTPAVSCNAHLPIPQLSYGRTHPREFTDRLQVTSITDDSCELVLTRAPPDRSTSPTPTAAPGSGLCISSGVDSRAASLAAGLALVVLVRRRDRSPEDDDTGRLSR